MPLDKAGALLTWHLVDEEHFPGVMEGALWWPAEFIHPSSSLLVSLMLSTYYFEVLTFPDATLYPSYTFC